jgi:hypothetical protein
MGNIFTFSLDLRLKLTIGLNGPSTVGYRRLVWLLFTVRSGMVGFRVLPLGKRLAVGIGGGLGVPPGPDFGFGGGG